MFRFTSTKRKRHNRRDKRAGVAAVEMALVAPFVFFLFFVSIEFSRMMMVRQALTNAAREGCRKATLVTTRDSSEADLAVREKLTKVIAGASKEKVVRVEIEPGFTSSPDAGTKIVTTVEVNCDDVSWLPPMFFAGAKISATATMTRE